MLELSRARLDPQPQPAGESLTSVDPSAAGQGPLCPLLHRAGGVLLYDLLLREEEDEDSLFEEEFKTQDMCYIQVGHKKR